MEAIQGVMAVAVPPVQFFARCYNPVRRQAERGANQHVTDDKRAGITQKRPHTRRAKQTRATRSGIPKQARVLLLPTPVTSTYRTAGLGMHDTRLKRPPCLPPRSLAQRAANADMDTRLMARKMSNAEQQKLSLAERAVKVTKNKVWTTAVQYKKSRCERGNTVAFGRNTEK